jgi:hypothetical protein
LALGPFLAAVACSTYDDSLMGNTAGVTGAGTNSAGGGTAGSSGSLGSGAGGTVAGMSTGGTTAGTAGSASGGTSGDNANIGGGGSSSAGSAGAPVMTMAGAGGEPAESDDPIDNMEDGNAQVELSDGRNGFWYVGNDGTASGSSVPPPATFSMFELTAGDRSMYAAHLKAAGFTGWGSDIGFNLIEVAGALKPYDASAYCGVQFWGKAAANVPLRFRIPDIDTHPAGKVCADPGAAGTSCYDHFGISESFTTTWKPFVVKFADLQQTGTGYHPADKKLKPNSLFSLEWALPGGAAATYEIWIDDVEFVKCK